MNIAHIVFGMTVGGIETMLANIASEQVSHANRVGIFIINDLENAELIKSIDPRVDIIRIKRPVGSKNPWHIVNLNRALLRFNPDVVHLHKAKIYNYILPRFRRISCVTQHDILIQDDITPLPHIKYIFAISRAVSLDIKSRLGIDSNVLYNGIHTLRFNFNKRNESEVLKCICSGRLMHEKKGQHVLIKAVSMLPLADRAKITLDIVGEGDSLSYLKNLVDSLELNSVVTFKGLKSQQWLCEHLCEYDLFIAPSLYEGFGLTIVEAMCAGVPVLVSDIQGPMEVINDGKYGRYFRCGDSEDCAKEISKILYGDVDQNIAKVARQYALKEFDVKNTARGYLDEYERIKGFNSK